MVAEAGGSTSLICSERGREGVRITAADVRSINARLLLMPIRPTPLTRRGGVMVVAANAPNTKIVEDLDDIARA